MKNSLSIHALLSMLLLGLGASASRADVIVSGTAFFTIQEGLANGISEFDALFSATTSRTDTLGLPAPGNAPFSEAATVQLIDPVRPHGATPPSGDGRTRQVTNLDFNPANPLGSWTAATDTAGMFVSGGEQIGLTLMQRYTGPFPGALLYGDFALRYVPARAGVTAAGGTLSGLVLTSNIDFADASWADLANATISATGNTLNISGTLLMSGGLAALDPSAVPGTPFGGFAMTATTVPEASTGMLGLSALAFFALRRRR